VLDGDGKVFLVRHSYVSGWHLPGGGVEVGETFLEALRRELVEEGRIELTGEPVLHGLFLNAHVSRRDHVAVYIVRQFRQDRLPEPNYEIVECGFYAVGALPAETTRGTRLRIAEVLDGVAPIATWR
jgi:8-oxo-dGTP pyrophosphatase MutT (NUDIX family)